MDLTVGGDRMQIQVSSLGYVVLDPHSQTSINQVFKPFLIPTCIPAHTRALLVTAEPVRTLEAQLGLVAVRSTWSRLGIVMNTGVVQPNFKGHLTMEVLNSNDCAILIRPGDRIWTFITVPYLSTSENTGFYQDLQQGPSIIEPVAGRA